MKPYTKNQFLLPLLLAYIGLLPQVRVVAQVFTTLHNFTGGTDGSRPIGGLILSGNALFGTASTGGSFGNGTIFAVNIDGSGFTNLYTFTTLSVPISNRSTNSDGAHPKARLTLSGNTLYGTTENGGYANFGTVFAIKTDGSGFTNLHSFAGYPNEGANPLSGLILSGSTLYGTTYDGGSFGNGTVFALKTDGTGFTNLYNFTRQSGPFPNYDNSDGTRPNAGLVLSGNTLYGTASSGGNADHGTVFAVNTDGSGFTNLHTFTAFDINSIINTDGAYPNAELLLLGDTLYGTAVVGESAGNGTVFAIKTYGTGFTNLHSFASFVNDSNPDGAFPQAGLVFQGNTLYGTASGGGSFGNKGTIFAVNTDGTGFTNLYSFTAASSGTNNDGTSPRAGLILSGNTLYGTAESGGIADHGTLFSLSLSPQLAITLSQAEVVLTWPTNVAGFDYTGYTLQSTANLDSSVVWLTNFQPAVVVNGQNTVTNPVSGTQKFYRLIK